MSKRFFAILTVLALLAAPLAAFDGLATVFGKCTDDDGKPIVGATVKFNGTETGLKYELKTSKSGEFRTIGMQAGVYKITLVAVDGTELWYFNNKRITLDVEGNQVDFDLKKEHSGQGQGKVDQKAMAEATKQQAEIKKENAAISQINDLMSQSKTAQDQGNFDQAITFMKQAAVTGEKYDLIWGRLGEVYMASAKQSRQPEQWSEAAKAFQKAIEIASAPDATDKSKNALGDYYNNLGETQAQAGDMGAATKAYEKAAELTPAEAGKYYFNLGAHLTNRNQPDAAIVAFDKSIAADPAKAEAYYWKGVALIGKATLGKNNQMVAPPGTAEALNKYLELKPDGPLADGAKQLLATIGAKVQTTYTAKKKK